MPIPPKPFKYVCSKCKYKKIVKLKSDAINAKDLKKLSNICPKCANQMEVRELSVFDNFSSKIFRF